MEPTRACLLLFVGEAVRPDAPLAALLARDGLRCLHLAGVEQAARAAALARFDAVLVDAALAAGPALAALAAAHRAPIVVLAEAADEVDEIIALELGADLYLARPLAPRRLRAHLRALLRRAAATAPATAPGASATAVDEAVSARRAVRPAPTLDAGGWTLEWARQRLVCHGERGERSVRLSQAQTAMLRCLMAAPGEVVAAEELLAALPHHERLHPRSLRVHVHRLRQRLREEGVEELRVDAVRGSGYVLAFARAPAARRVDALAA